MPWTTIMGLLGAWRWWVLIGGAATLVGTATYFVKDYEYRGRQIMKLERANNVNVKRLAAKDAQEKLLVKNIDTLNEELKKRSGELEDICKVYEANEKDERPEGKKKINGVIGDVLDYLDAGSD